ncbi:tRNA uridine-5-carboxymethylaminomethyl(34) synthesis GTPase MnmE [uncultured Sphingomonas sp.]|uniref:tRNA uridine-5-carboxymethylaminomethyl(34) synthesis GTPase MnmE n=1 Tax=uncultured Sphingomonas sp. TaxID=158754 RepID=UPI0035CC41B3
MAGTGDTIVALSSGRPPAAIGVIRLSGPAALAAATALAGTLPPPRRAGLRALRDAAGELLDRALVIVFPGSDSATGEDLVELHCHGGRAVTAAVEAAVASHAGVRRAEPGEFTRRSLTNGRIDLAEAEGLADLLAAETEAQRRLALDAASGVVTRRLTAWMDRLADLAAAVEVAIDYAGEGEGAGSGEREAALDTDATALLADLRRALAEPTVERIRDGIRVTLAGPPNSGKSTLLNALVERDVAIVSPVAGTTRDRIEAPVQREGMAFVFTDTAGLTMTQDVVEAIGVDRAREAIEAADLLLWLGDDPPPRSDALTIHARADAPGREAPPPDRLPVSARRGEGLSALWQAIVARAVSIVPVAGTGALTVRQRDQVGWAAGQLAAAMATADLLIVAEELRMARACLGRLLGIDATEAMLDALFSRFCLGK